MNKITALEIKKFIISHYGVDPTPLFKLSQSDEHIRDFDMAWAAISDYSKNRAAERLNEIVNKLRDVFPEHRQGEIVNEINTIRNMSGRGSRFAIILLMTALKMGLINKSVYKQTRESWGFNSYSPEIEMALEEPTEQKDDFQLLS